MLIDIDPEYKKLQQKLQVLNATAKNGANQVIPCTGRHTGVFWRSQPV